MQNTRSRPRLAPPGGDAADADIFRLLLEAMPDLAACLLDPEGCVRSWNAGAERLFGYAEADVLGQPLALLDPGDGSVQSLPAQALDAAREDGRFEQEGWRLRADGRRFWSLLTLVRLDLPGGGVRGFAMIVRDLSANRRQEELLRLSEERFRLMVESVRDYAIFMIDPSGHVATWNLGAQITKGYTSEEIIGRHFSVFYPPEPLASGWPLRELELALRDGRVEDEGWRVRKDGSRFWASVVITALFDEGGRHVGFAKVTRDLSDKKRVRALEDEGRRVTTFLALLGHELRNPLAPIANAVSILQMEEPESERVRLCRDVLSRQVGQLSRLVDDLLDVGRITNGKIRLTLEPLDLGSVLAEAVETIEPVARQRGHVLHADFGPRGIRVDGDRARLLQVLTNLLHNAVKFTPPGGRIHARLRRTGDHVEVSVRDNGPGIPPDRLADIFNLFEQIEPATGQPPLGGLGLGLSLVQQLVALHGGDVSAFSAGEPGEGAEFVVRLPLAGPELVERELPAARQGARVDDNDEANVDANVDAGEVDPLPGVTVRPT